MPAKSSLDSEERLKRRVLANGLRLDIETSGLRIESPSILIQLAVGGGAAQDPVERRGLAHVVEHVLWSRGVRRIKRLKTKSLKLISARTEYDYTYYTLQCAAEECEASLDAIQSLLHWTTTTPREVAAAVREVIHEKRVGYAREDHVFSPFAKIYDHVHALAYESHPYHWYTVGHLKDLKRISSFDCDGYLARHYGPKNAILRYVLLGHSPEQARQSTARVFAKAESVLGTGGFNPGFLASDPVRAEEESIGFRSSVVHERKKGKSSAASLAVGVKLPRLTSREGVVADFLAFVFRKHFMDKYNPYVLQGARFVCGPLIPTRDPGLLIFAAFSANRTLNLHEDFFPEFLSVARVLSTRECDAETLDQWREFFKLKFVIECELAIHRGPLELLGQIPLSARERLQVIDQLTPRDFLDFTKRTLDPQQMSVSYLARNVSD